MKREGSFNMALVLVLLVAILFLSPVINSSHVRAQFAFKFLNSFTTGIQCGNMCI